MKRLIHFLTNVYDDRDTYIQVKAKHTSIMLMLICLSIFIELIYVLFFSEDKTAILLADSLGLTFFIIMMFFLKKGHLILTGNLFVFAGTMKLIDFFPITSTFQFYLQCFLALIVAIAIYVHKYQLYLTLFPIIGFSISRLFLIQGDLDLLAIDKTDYMAEVYQATAAVFIYALILLFYDKIIAQEIKNTAKLKKLSETDMLTNLYNRQKFNSTIQALRDGKSKFCLALIDLDHFKNINDSYGHKIGDMILQEFSILLLNTFGQNDYVFRWGGEEFAIIALQEIDPLFISELESFRETVAKHTFSIPTHITISIGYVCSRDFTTEETMLIHADRALYKAKDNGRNRIEHVELEVV